MTFKLFILDSGPTVKPSPLAVSSRGRESSLDASEAAWHDSDDDRITVSLHSNPRTRKLREYEGEDLINGREYTKRLRRQYERLNPTPDWATQARTESNGPKSRAGYLKGPHDSDQESASEGEMSIDTDEISAPPLSKLLQQPGAFIQSNQGLPKGKRKLRPEVIDIQRTKDVGVAQPVSIKHQYQVHRAH